MKTWQKIVGIIILVAIGIFELLLWAWAITDWEETPFYLCITWLSHALWLNYGIALILFIWLWRKGGKR